MRNVVQDKDLMVHIEFVFQEQNFQTRRSFFKVDAIELDAAVQRCILINNSE